MHAASSRGHKESDTTERQNNVYVQLIHFAVRLKLIQHCKSYMRIKIVQK